MVKWEQKKAKKFGPTNVYYVSNYFTSSCKLLYKYLTINIKVSELIVWIVSDLVY